MLQTRLGASQVARGPWIRAQISHSTSRNSSMSELFYFPGACSLAVHIALIEANLPYTLKHVNVFEGEHQKPEYRAIHPLARIPSLRLADATVLSEVAAILQYIDGQMSEPTLPSVGLARARVAEWLSLFASAVHIPFAQRYNPRRFTDDESIHEILRRDGLKRGHEMLKYVDSQLSAAGTVLASGPSLLDSYALVFFLWGMRGKLPVAELPRYKSLAKSQVERSAVRRALHEESLGYVADLVRAM
jgi:glutathione S-transferase